MPTASLGRRDGLIAAHVTTSSRSTCHHIKPDPLGEGGEAYIAKSVRSTDYTIRLVVKAKSMSFPAPPNNWRN